MLAAKFKFRCEVGGCRIRSLLRNSYDGCPNLVENHEKHQGANFPAPYGACVVCVTFWALCMRENQTVQTAQSLEVSAFRKDHGRSPLNNLMVVSRQLGICCAKRQKKTFQTIDRIKFAIATTSTTGWTRNLWSRRTRIRFVSHQVGDFLARVWAKVIKVWQFRSNFIGSERILSVVAFFTNLYRWRSEISFNFRTIELFEWFLFLPLSGHVPY